MFIYNSATTFLFFILFIIQLLEWDNSLVEAQYIDNLTSGTILNNLWRKRRDLTKIEENKINNKRWADFYTSGTILNNLWRRKRFTEQQQNSNNLKINSNRFKRQFYADGLTSGTILNNLWG